MLLRKLQGRFCRSRQATIETVVSNTIALQILFSFFNAAPKAGLFPMAEY